MKSTIRRLRKQRTRHLEYEGLGKHEKEFIHITLCLELFPKLQIAERT